MLTHQSIATIQQPEFINLSPNDINPLISNCEIKVLYVGENRNRSFISKEVAEDMAKTLRGTPIVGHYMQDKEDFGGHDSQIIFDGDGIKFSELTIPYGFVAPNARVWFQTFVDDDSIQREYLMTEGYLWTTQFKECADILKNSKGQSMELDEETLSGEWTKAINQNYDLFIINDATFSKLCILGDDVEPCFEGASISANNSHFSLMNSGFTNTLFAMINDMKQFNIEERSSEQMDNMENGATVETTEKATAEVVEPVETTQPETPPVTETVEPNVDEANPVEEGVAAHEEEEKNEEVSVEATAEYQLLLSKYNSLETEHEELKAKYSELLAFKNEVENNRKDELINSFYMLSDEDKQDVIANKEKYSYDDIEAKLSVICVRKKVNFAAEEEKEDTKEPITYSLNNSEDNDIPAWLKAIDDAHKNNMSY